MWVLMRGLRQASDLLAPHLRGEFADVVFVEQVAERTDWHLEEISGFRLVAAALS